MVIDRSRAAIKKTGFQFAPLRPPPDAGAPLAALELPAETEILVFERGGAKRGLLVRHMAYHHVAQGELAGHPYLVTF